MIGNQNLKKIKKKKKLTEVHLDQKYKRHILITSEICWGCGIVVPLTLEFNLALITYIFKNIWKNKWKHFYNFIIMFQLLSSRKVVTQWGEKTRIAQSAEYWSFGQLMATYWILALHAQ